MVRDAAPWGFLWQQRDLHGVANWVEWTPRADEKVDVRSEGDAALGGNVRAPSGPASRPTA